MLVRVTTKDGRSKQAVNELLERKLALGFDRFSGEVEGIDLRVTDANGPKGGMDQHCRIVVHLAHKLRVVVEDTGSNLYAVVASALERAEFAVRKQIERRRSHV